MSDGTVQAQQAVEAILAHRISNEDGFAARLAADPKATIAPIIAEVVEDDGDLDFSNTEFVLHNQSEDQLHFVIPREPAEVAGYGFRMSFGLDRMVMAPVFRGAYGDSGTQTTCASTGGEDDAKCQPTPTAGAMKFGI